MGRRPKGPEPLSERFEVRLSKREVRWVDQLVEQGVGDSRGDVLRKALAAYRPRP